MHFNFFSYSKSVVLSLYSTINREMINIELKSFTIRIENLINERV